MKKVWRSYRVFLTVPYQVVWLFLIPTLLLAFELFIGIAGNEKTWFVITVTAACYIVITEVLSDYFLFGGICADKGSNTKCFVTSMEGRSVLRNALCMDLARHFLYSTIYGIALTALTGRLLGIQVGLFIYIVSATMLNVTRYLPNFQLHLAVSMAAPFLYLLLILPYEWLEFAGYLDSGILAAVVLVLSLAVSAVLSVVTVRHMLWRIGVGKESDRDVK